MTIDLWHQATQNPLCKLTKAQVNNLGFCLSVLKPSPLKTNLWTMLHSNS